MPAVVAWPVFIYRKYVIYRNGLGPQLSDHLDQCCTGSLRVHPVRCCRWPLLYYRSYQSTPTDELEGHIVVFTRAKRGEFHHLAEYVTPRHWTRTRRQSHLSFVVEALATRSKPKTRWMGTPLATMHRVQYKLEQALSLCTQDKHTVDTVCL
ncbi:hypothetical protein BC629DRAFT_1076786 [Irpex lacteus]|nr:hypothetical protein BC629DRAFT_1076786 [Irpex lacteus]